MNARLLDTFDRRLRLEGVLATRTGLHVGAGESGDPLATDSPVVRNASGVPFVPGSSLKGVVRSASESLFRGAAPRPDAGEEELWSCDHIASKPCVSHDRLKEIQRRHDKDPRAAAEQIWGASCTVCRLFGSLALASRVRFPDRRLAGLAPLLELRNGVGIDRDKELAASGVLYDFEAVPPETPFRLTVILDNYEDWEAGLLLYLFEQLDQGSLALGGKTSRGLGQVRIEWQEMLETRVESGNPFAELLSSMDLLATEPEAEEPAAAEPEAELPTSGDPEAWRILAGILGEMPEIDKGMLGQEAAKHDLTKAVLNDRLNLGLEGKHTRKAWDVVLERFVETGLLVKRDGRYALAGAEPEERTVAAEEAPPDQDPALRRVYKRYIQAMSDRWEASF